MNITLKSINIKLSFIDIKIKFMNCKINQPQYNRLLNHHFLSSNMNLLLPLFDPKLIENNLKYNVNQDLVIKEF